MAALYSSFTSGLTLLQTLAIQHDIIPYRQSSRGVRACTSVLVAYATLFPEARGSSVRGTLAAWDPDQHQNHSESLSKSSSTAWRMITQSQLGFQQPLRKYPALHDSTMTWIRQRARLPFQYQQGTLFRCPHGRTDCLISSPACRAICTKTWQGEHLGYPLS